MSNFHGMNNPKIMEASGEETRIWFQDLKNNSKILLGIQTKEKIDMTQSQMTEWTDSEEFKEFLSVSERSSKNMPIDIDTAVNQLLRDKLIRWLLN